MNLENEPRLHFVYVMTVTLFSFLGINSPAHLTIHFLDVVWDVVIKTCPLFAVYVPNRKFFNEKARSVYFKFSHLFNYFFKSKKK